MFAIRCLRHASGATVDGTHYAHDKWTLADALAPAVETAGVPEQGRSWALLEVREVKGPKDNALAPFEVATAPSKAADRPAETAPAEAVEDVTEPVTEPGVEAPAAEAEKR